MADINNGPAKTSNSFSTQLSTVTWDKAYGIVGEFYTQKLHQDVQNCRKFREEEFK
ncbi:hypothetical protein P7K49_031676, partial [Saguinus oedipus]